MEKYDKGYLLGDQGDPFFKHDYVEYNYKENPSNVIQEDYPPTDREVCAKTQFKSILKMQEQKRKLEVKKQLLIHSQIMFLILQNLK